jgi:hypothetical protein
MNEEKAYQKRKEEFEDRVSEEQERKYEQAKESLEKVNMPAKEFDIDSYLSKRKQFIDKVNKIMVEHKDYHVIQGRKSLGKGGAEKIAAIFNWQASFMPDEETIKMLGLEKGIIAYICRLTKDGQFIGEGRGARTLVQDKGDVNKAIKMAAKSAYVDSVLRASGLSDFFTQDLGEEENGYDILSDEVPNVDINKLVPGHPPVGTINVTSIGRQEVKPISKAQLTFIKSLLKRKNLPVNEEELAKLTSPEASDKIAQLTKDSTK